MIIFFSLQNITKYNLNVSLNFNCEHDDQYLNSKSDLLNTNHFEEPSYDCQVSFLPVRGNQMSFRRESFSVQQMFRTHAVVLSPMQVKLFDLKIGRCFRCHDIATYICKRNFMSHIMVLGFRCVTDTRVNCGIF